MLKQNLRTRYVNVALGVDQLAQSGLELSWIFTDLLFLVFIII